MRSGKTRKRKPAPNPKPKPTEEDPFTEVPIRRVVGRVVHDPSGQAWVVFRMPKHKVVRLKTGKLAKRVAQDQHQLVSVAVSVEQARTLMKLPRGSIQRLEIDGQIIDLEIKRRSTRVVNRNVVIFIGRRA